MYRSFQLIPSPNRVKSKPTISIFSYYNWVKSLFVYYTELFHTIVLDNLKNSSKDNDCVDLCTLG